MSDHDHHEAPVNQNVVDAAAAGCNESRLLINRRALMGLSASFFAWAHVPRIAKAAEPGTEPRLLIVLMRGALDGLHVAVPLNDPNYARLRGNLALNPKALLPLSSDFGLHPALPNFHKMYQAGDAALVHAVAPPLRNRSHFECMHNLEIRASGGPEPLDHVRLVEPGSSGSSVTE